MKYTETVIDRMLHACMYLVWVMFGVLAFNAWFL